jgi:hypothetical protein
MGARSPGEECRKGWMIRSRITIEREVLYARPSGLVVTAEPRVARI